MMLCNLFPCMIKRSPNRPHFQTKSGLLIKVLICTNPMLDLRDKVGVELRTPHWFSK